MKTINNKIKRKLRNRKKLKEVNNNRYRISVSKSLKNLSAQIIDDIKNLKTVEPYKGKDIKEKRQFDLRKEGKKK